MRKFFKIIAGLVGVLTGLVLISFAILVNLNFNDYREDIAAQISKATGRPFSINGNLDVNLSMVPVIKASGIIMGNAEWSAYPDMLAVDTVSVKVDLLSLFFEPIDIHNISVSGVEILLETAPSGIKNYQFSDQPDMEKTNLNPKEKVEKTAQKIDDGLMLPIFRKIDMNDIHITFHDGASGEDRSLTIKEIALSGDAPTEPMQLAVDIIGELGISAVLHGVLGSPRTMLNPNEPWAVDIFGDVAGVTVDIKGAIDDPITGAGVDLKIAADGEELANIGRLFLMDTPDFGKFRLDGDLKGSIGENMNVSNLILEVGSVDTVLIKATGQLADLYAMKGLDISLELSSDELGNLSPFSEKWFKKEIPALGAMHLSAYLQGGIDSGLSLKAFDLEAGTSDRVKILAKGAVVDLIKVEGVDIEIDLAADEVGRLSTVSERFTGYKIPALGPLGLKSTFKGGLNTTLAAQGIDFKLGKRSLVKLTASGTIADLYNQEGVSLIISADAEELSRMNEISSLYDAPPVPEIGPVALSGVLSGGLNNQLSLSDLNLSAGDGEQFFLLAVGSIKDVINPKGLVVDIDAKIKNLANLSELTGQDLPPLGPLEIKASVNGDRSEKLDITNLIAKIGKSDVAGNFSYDTTGVKPTGKGIFTSMLLRKSDFGLEDNKALVANDNISNLPAGASGNVGNTDQEVSGKFVISDEPIVLDFLKLVDGDFEVKVATIEGGDAKLQDFSAKASLVEGMLTVDYMRFSDRKGNPVDINFALDSTKSTPTIKTVMKATTFEIKELTQILDFPNYVSGPVDVDINLTAAGHSPHALAGSLTGNANLFLNNGLIDSKKIRKEYAEEYALLADVVLGRPAEGLQKVYCVVLDYKIKNGLVLVETNVMDTEISTLTSSGTINLADETLNMTVTPHRSIVGLPATVPVLVGGTFMEPNYLPNPVGTVFNLTKSLLGGAVNIVTLGEAGQSLFGENSPCKNLRPGALQENKENQQQQEQNLKDDSEKIIKNLLKGIFQN